MKFLTIAFACVLVLLGTAFFLGGDLHAPETETPPSDPSDQPLQASQSIALPAVGLALEVPGDWAVHTEAQTDHLPARAEVSLVNKADDAEGSREVIHFAMQNCARETARVDHLEGGELRRIADREGAWIVQAFSPGTANMPFKRGAGLEVAFEDEEGPTRVYLYKFIYADRCYTLSIENSEDRFLEQQAAYETILRSIMFRDVTL